MAECPTVIDFRARFPEFAATATNEQIQLYLDDACGYLSDAALGDCWERAVLFYAAHLLIVSQRATELGSNAAASGTVSGSSGGGLSISFNSAAPKDSREAWYQSTIYGQQFWTLIQEIVDMSAVTGGVY